MVKFITGSVFILFALLQWVPQADAGTCSFSAAAGHAGSECLAVEVGKLQTIHNLNDLAAGAEEFQLAQGVLPSCPAGYHLSKGMCMPGAAPRSTSQAPPLVGAPRAVAPRVAPRAPPRAAAPRMVAPPRVAPRAVAPRTVAPQQAAMPPLSPGVKDYLTRWRNFVAELGLDSSAPHTFSVQSRRSCPPLLIHCKKAVSSADGLRGLRLRATGANSKFVERVGGIRVNLVGSEIPEALKNRVIDCVVGGGEVLACSVNGAVPD